MPLPFSVRYLLQARLFKYLVFKTFTEVAVVHWNAGRAVCRGIVHFLMTAIAAVYFFLTRDFLSIEPFL